MRLQLNQKIEPKMKKSLYVLELKFYHGDSDFTTIKKIDFHQFQFDSLLKVIDVLLDYLKNKYNIQEIYEYLEEKYSDIMINEDSNFLNYLEVLWQRDYVYIDNLAMLDDFKLFYYNENGEKYSISIVE